MNLYYIVNTTSKPIELDLGGIIAPHSRSVKALGENKYSQLEKDYTTKEHNGSLFVFRKGTKKADIERYIEKIEKSNTREEVNQAKSLARIYHHFIKEFQKEKEDWFKEFDKDRKELTREFDKDRKELIKEFQKEKEDLLKELKKGK